MNFKKLFEKSDSLMRPPLVKQASERLPELYDLPNREAEKLLKELGYSRLDAYTQEIVNYGVSEVWKKTQGGDGVSEIPYVYLVQEDKVVTFVSTGATPGENPEVLAVNVTKMATQAKSA